MIDTNAAPASLDTIKQNFLADGFCRIDEAIDDAELEQLGRIYHDCFSDDRHRDVRRKALGGVDGDGRQMLPQVLFPSSGFPELREMKYFKTMKQVADHFLDADAEARGEHMILKPAGYGVATPWHQDQAYHQPDLDYRNINFWLPLDGATVEGGCMQYVRKSHRGAVLPHEYLIPGDTQSALVAQDQDYWSLNASVVPCPRGSVCLHHSYCMHYAGPNTTDLPRRAYIIAFGVEPTPLDRPWVLPWLKR